MKIVKLRFLSKEYEIKCKEDEIPKIKILQEKLNNRINNISNIGNNFTDTHKLLVAALFLEDKVNDLLLKEKKLIQEIEDINLNSKTLFKEDLKKIREKIKSIISKIS